MTNPDPQRDLHVAAAEVIRALDEPGANPEYHAKQKAHLHMHWPVLSSRLFDLRVAATFSTAGVVEYGIQVILPDQQFMHLFDNRQAWITNKELAVRDLAALRNNPQLREADIRIVARRVSPTWEVEE